MVVAVPYAVVPAMAAWGSSARVVAGAAWSHRAERSLTGSATVRLGSVASTSGRHHIRTQAAAGRRRDATATEELSVEQLMAMKVPELRSWAKQRGVSGYSKLRKHELATLLAAQESVAQEPLDDFTVSANGPHASTHRTQGADLAAQPQPPLESEPSALWPPLPLEGESSSTTATATAAGGYRPPDSTSFQPPQRPLTSKRSMPKWRRKGPADWECPAWFAEKFTAVIERYPAGLYLEVLPHVYERFHGEPLPSHSMFGFAQETAFYQYGVWHTPVRCSPFNSPTEWRPFVVHY